MHSPQRMQRARKNSSSTDPGGRSKRSSRSAAKPGVLRMRGTTAAPAASPVRSLRRCRLAPARLLRGKQLELQGILRTLADAVQAQMTFRLMPGNAANRVVTSLAAQQATITVIAFRGIFHQPQHGPAGDQAQKRSQRADCAAPEAGDPKIQSNHEDEECSQPDALPEIGLLEIEQQRAEKEVQHCSNCPAALPHGTLFQQPQECLQSIVGARQDRQGRASAPETRTGRASPQCPCPAQRLRALQRASSIWCSASACSGSTRPIACRACVRISSLPKK